MAKKKLIYARLFAVLLTTVFLVACTAPQETTTVNNTNTAAQETPTSIPTNTAPQETPTAKIEAEPVKPPLMNETGLPIVNEPVTLKFAAAQADIFKPGFEGIEMLERWEKETGITIEWDTYPAASWGERKSQIIASGELPDVFAGGGAVGQQTLTEQEVLAWAKQGIIIPLGDLIDKYMPRFKQILEENPVYKENIMSPDGNVYSFPATADIDFGQKGALLYINRKWLEETGRTLPVKGEKHYNYLDHKFTTDEFYELLKDFKRIHPEGIPFSAVRDGQPLGGLFDMYGAFGQKDDTNRLIVQNDNVIFTADKEPWKEATKYFHKLYSEGLMDPEYFTQDYATYLAKVAKKPLVVGVSLMWTNHQAEPDITSADYRNWLLTAPLVGKDGQQNWNLRAKGSGIGGFVITATNPHPEISARFQDYLYEEENSYQLSMGPLGRNTEKGADGMITMNNMPEGMSDAEWRGQNLNTMFITTPAMNSKVIWSDLVQMTIDQGAFIKKYSLADKITRMYPRIQFNAEDSEKLATLKTDILEYVTEMQAKWITEGTIDQDWDDYLKKLDQIGLAEYLEIMQRNLNR